jgi:hypothetical protein
MIEIVTIVFFLKRKPRAHFSHMRRLNNCLVLLNGPVMKAYELIVQSLNSNSRKTVVDEHEYFCGDFNLIEEIC